MYPMNYNSVRSKSLFSDLQLNSHILQDVVFQYKIREKCIVSTVIKLISPK